MTFPPGGCRPRAGPARCARSPGRRWPSEPLWICAVRTDDARRVVFGRDEHAGDRRRDRGRRVGRDPGLLPAGRDRRPPVRRRRRPLPHERRRRCATRISTSCSCRRRCRRRATRRCSTLSQPMRRHFRLRLGQEVRRLRKRGIPVVVFQPSGDDQAAMGGKAMDPERNATVVRATRETTLRRLVHGRHADRLAMLGRVSVGLGMDGGSSSKRAGLVAGAAALRPSAARCSARAREQSPATSFDSILNHRPKDSGIDTVVIVMMENRSFDHYLGWLADDDEYLDAGRKRYGKKFHVRGKNQMTLPRPARATSSTTAHLVTSINEPEPFRGCDHPIPGHGWNSGRAQRDRGFLGKDTGNDQFALGLLRSRRPPAVPARWPSASPSATLARVAARGHVPEPAVPARGDVGRPQGGPDPARGRHLQGADVLGPARQGARAGALLLLRPAGPHAVGRPAVRPASRAIDDYFDDAPPASSPNVVMIDPPFAGENRADDHPQGDIRTGQRFVREVFRPSPSRRTGRRARSSSSTTSGVASSTTAAPRSSPTSARARSTSTTSARAASVCPRWSRRRSSQPGSVDHTLYDHTSIMRFLEWRFLGAPPHGPNHTRQALVAHRARPQRGEHRPGARAREAQSRARLRRRPPAAVLLPRPARPRRWARSAGPATARCRRPCRR